MGSTIAAEERAALRADVTLAYGRPERDVRVSADDLAALLDALDEAERQQSELRHAVERARDRGKATSTEREAWAGDDDSPDCCSRCDAVEISHATLARLDSTTGGRS
jgi:hypothetical protein